MPDQVMPNSAHPMFGPTNDASVTLGAIDTRQPRSPVNLPERKPSCLDFPSFSKGGSQIGVCLRAIGELHRGGVPLQFASTEAHRYNPQQGNFRERATITEIGSSGPACFAGFNPL